MFLLECIIGSACPANQQPQKDFEIFHSYKTGSDNFTHTSLTVIVNAKDYDIDEMFEKVVEEHNRINGIPDELEIRLYNGQQDYENYICAGSKTFYKANMSCEYLL